MRKLDKDSIVCNTRINSAEGIKVMSEHTVVGVVDGNTLDVIPDWSRDGASGSRVRLAGFDARELGAKGAATAKERLSSLVLHEKVELGEALDFDRGRLICNVYRRGYNLVTHLT